MRFTKSGSIRYAQRGLGFQAAIVAALLCAVQAGTAWAQTPTAWTNTSGGVWSDVPSWSNGVPNGNDAKFPVAGVSYTVTYDAPAPAFRDLIITNSAGYTSTLTITSTAFASGRTNLFKNGAVVNVNTGGDWRATYAQAGSIEVLEGASLNINGGTMLYTNLLKGFLFNLYGSSSVITSYLNMTSGRFEFGGTNDAYAAGAASPTFNFGYKAPGVINISGGTCVVQRLYGWDIGSSAAGRGYINITGGELVITGQTAATGPYCAVGPYGGYGEVNVSGDGKATLYVRQWAVGGYNGAGRFTVNGGSATVNGTVYAGYRGINSTGVVEVTAGTLRVSTHVYLGSEPYAANYFDSGIVNVYGGTFTIDGGLWAGQAGAALMTNRIGRVTVTNGILHTKSSITVAEVSKGGKAYGELNLSDSGIISNWGNLIVGYGTGAVGVVNQTAGTLDQNYNSSVTYLGDNGGSGTFNMSGGLIQNKYTAYVGGKIGQNSIGALNISGGTFQMYAQPLYIGEAGTGTLSMIGSQGTLSGSALTATGGTSKISFNLGTNGAGAVTMSGAVSIGSNTTIDITVTNYDWPVNGLTVDLISYGTLTGTFGATNVTIGGVTDGALASGTIIYGDGSNDKIQLQLSKRPVGTIFYAR